MLDAANYRAIEKLRDGRSYIIRAQRRDDNIIAPSTCALDREPFTCGSSLENIA